MARTAIVTDSSSGISYVEGQAWGIFIAPMPIFMDGAQYFEDVNLSSEEFYERLTEDVKLSTSQPITGALVKFWTEILKTHDEIVYIPLSSALSSSYQTAKSLAEDFKGKVQVVDNKRVSITLKQSVFDAKVMAKKGLPAIKIKEYLEKTKDDYAAFLMLSTLSYIKKGGRLKTSSSAPNSALRWRPILELKSDRFHKYCMTTTTSKKAKPVMIEGITAELNGRFKKFVDKGQVVLHVAHIQNEKKAKIFRAELQTLFPNISVEFVDAIPLCLACHVGPKALAVAITTFVK